MGRPRIAVADIGGEELDEAFARRRTGGNDLRRYRGLLVDNDEPVLHKNSVDFPPEIATHKGRYVSLNERVFRVSFFETLRGAEILRIIWRG
jgi:hypothetical protein